MKYPPPPIFEACVRKPGLYAEQAWCGNTIKVGEFAFVDPGHAAKHYDRTKHLQACPQCVEAIKRLRPDLVVK